jgi:hypothetical protein
MKTQSRLTILVVATIAAACGGATVGAQGDSPSMSPRSSTIDYVGGCTASACADLPILTVACASGPTTTVCEPGSAGACVIDIECGAPPSSVTTCEPSACGDVELTVAPECPVGGTIVNDCVNTGSDCAWEPKCVPPNGPSCAPSSCGPEPTVAPICNDGEVGELVCAAGAGGSCGWVSSCDNGVGHEVDGGEPSGPPGEVDGGDPGAPGHVGGHGPTGDSGVSESPPIDGGDEGFDAAAWADAKGA